MNINFNDATYERMKFCASAEGKSVAAWVSQQMDRITADMVNVAYTFKPGAEPQSMSMDNVITTTISASDWNSAPRMVGNYQLGN